MEKESSLRTIYQNSDCISVMLSVCPPPCVGFNLRLAARFQVDESSLWTREGTETPHSFLFVVRKQSPEPLTYFPRKSCWPKLVIYLFLKQKVAKGMGGPSDKPGATVVLGMR